MFPMTTIARAMITARDLVRLTNGRGGGATPELFSDNDLRSRLNGVMGTVLA
jgi:hypothetical protein